MSAVTIAILSGSRWNRPCAKCGRPITLGRRADTRAWMAFDADPRLLTVVVRPNNPTVLEEWALADRHRCDGPLFKEAAR